MTNQFLSIDDFTHEASPCGFYTPTKRESLMIVTPPETLSEHNRSEKCRKRQHMVPPSVDGSLFLPELSDFDSPIRFPPRRCSFTLQTCCDNTRLCMIPSEPLPMLPITFDQEDSRFMIKLAPRFQRERIMDLASDLMINKRMKLAPTTQKTHTSLPMEL